MTSQLTILNITKLDGYYRYSLKRPYDIAAIPAGEVVVDADAVALLSRMMREAVNGANDNATAELALETFVNPGHGLYNMLLPSRHPGLDTLRRTLRDLSTPLLICSDEHEIYWELLHDGEGQGFLGLKCDAGRQLITRGAPRPVRRRDHPWRALIIGDPNFDQPELALPGSAIEAARLRDSLVAKNINCDDCLIGPSATFEAVFERFLTHSYDIIHYAGHIVPDDEKGYGLLLNGEKLFSASIVKCQVQGAPAVFLNGCWGAVRGLGDSVGRLEGLTDAFMEAGAQIVVGSLFRTPDEGACQFAEKFYESLLARKAAGEAVREARSHVMREPGCGSAWACFVLYGDPRLRLEFDALQRALQAIRLGRGQFTAPCCAVLGRALEFAGVGEPTNTSHLFAALMDSGEPFLFDGLRRQGVLPEGLRDALRGVFEASSPGSYAVISDWEPSFSEVTSEILVAAGAVPDSGGSGSVTARDVAKAFVRSGGGNTGVLLRKMGIDVAALDTGSLAVGASGLPVRTGQLRIGRLSSSDCAPDTWAVLLHAADLAQQEGVGFIGTPQLFLAMLQDSDGILAARVRALGFDVPPAPPRRTRIRSLPGPDVACSGNVLQILISAQTVVAAEKRDHVSLADLLAAFVRQGGGEIGKSYRKEGKLLELLISDLFLDSGELDPSRFDEPSQRVVEAALACARNKDSQQVDRYHFLWGLLTASGEVSRRLQEQKIDARSLAERLYTRIKSELATGGPSQASAREMEPELVKIFCMAASDPARAPGGAIGENHLLYAWRREGGGAAGEFLLDFKVDPAALALPAPITGS